jgi:hypothetical protein
MATVRVYQVQLRLQSVRMARRVADRVLTEAQNEARANALIGQYSKGRLARSIYKTGPMVVGTTVHGSIGSRLGYAAAVEGGSGFAGPKGRAYNIFPKAAPHVYRFGRKRPPMLKFIWHGRVVYMNQIPGGPGTVGRSHPGQKGKHFIAKALVGVALRHHLRVIIFDL